MNSITISFGIGNSITRTFGTPVTVRTVLADPNVKGGLGYGESVSALINGAEVSPDFVLYGGESINVANKACSKA